MDFLSLSLSQTFRDSVTFTNLRIIVVDRQGMSGKKVRTSSYPYSKIAWFSTETAGTIDLDAELDVKIHGEQMPTKLRFAKGTDLSPIARALALKILL